MRDDCTEQVKQHLTDFTARYISGWQQIAGHPPASEEYYGIPSPCIVETRDTHVLWLPQSIQQTGTLENVERALDIRLREDIQAFYTVQYAGDMQAVFLDREMTLLQVWSEEDFIRLQENLIGHLVTQRRLKLSPTLFIATTASELEIISVCNVSGHVFLEQFGSKNRHILSENLPEFLQTLQPQIRQ